ncbi:MAG: ATP synthase F1 subunit delta [bacterium]
MLVDPVARPYAEALFAIARDRSTVDEVGAELREFGRLVDQNRDVATFLGSPVIEPATKVRHLRAALEGKASDLVTDTLSLVVEKGRFAALTDIVAAYLGMADDFAGRARVTVRTATPMSDSLREEMRKALSDGLRRTVELEAEVDPAVLGGAVVTVGDMVYDGSLRNRLRRFRQQISRRTGNEDQG